MTAIEVLTHWSVVVRTSKAPSYTEDTKPELCGPHSSLSTNVSHTIQISTDAVDIKPELCGPHSSLSTNVSHTIQISTDAVDTKPELCGPHSFKQIDVSQLPYTDASINPLPSSYGFITAPITADLQHEPVNPLPKETPHHG